MIQALKKITIYCLLILLPLMAFANETKTQEALEYYNFYSDVKFKLNDVFKVDLIQKGCYLNSKNLQACISAVNAMGKYLKPQIEIVPASLFPQLESTGEYLTVQKNLGSLLIVVLSERGRENRDSNLPSLKRNINKKRQLIQTSFENLIADTKKQINFLSLLEKMKASLILVDSNGLNIPEGLFASSLYTTLLTETYDPHTTLISKSQLMHLMNMGEKPSLFNLGVEPSVVNHQFIISSIFKNSPAEKAGLLPDDRIIEINGMNLEKIGREDISKLIQNILGNEIQITVLRDGERVSFKVKKGFFSIPNVTYKLLEDFSEKVGYIKIRSFMDPTSCIKTQEALLSQELAPAQSFILDLRDNFGGQSRVAACVAGLFVGNQKVIVSTYSNSHTNHPDHQFGLTRQITDRPLVVLVNTNSASSSEIVAGSLQDYQRAWVVGAPTFGKGSSQNIVPFSGDPNLFIAITSNLFRLPTGRTNQLVGITPDFLVSPKSEDIGFEDGLSEQNALREKDLFNALPASGEPWVQTRPQQVAKIKNCQKSQNLAEKSYAEKKLQHKSADFQLLVAEEALQCASGL